MFLSSHITSVTPIWQEKRLRPRKELIPGHPMWRNWDLKSKQTNIKILNTVELPARETLSLSSWAEELQPVPSSSGRSDLLDRVHEVPFRKQAWLHMPRTRLWGRETWPRCHGASGSMGKTVVKPALTHRCRDALLRKGLQSRSKGCYGGVGKKKSDTQSIPQWLDSLKAKEGQTTSSDRKTWKRIKKHLLHFSNKTSYFSLKTVERKMVQHLNTLT